MLDDLADQQPRLDHQPGPDPSARHLVPENPQESAYIAGQTIDAHQNRQTTQTTLDLVHQGEDPLVVAVRRITLITAAVARCCTIQ